MPSPTPTVAVIDIGSNSIKVLVVQRDADGRLAQLKHHTVDARIGTGISKASPLLTDDGMARGLAAVEELLVLSAPFSPAKTILVATSAVRDAANGAEFQQRVLAATGHPVRILSGGEEANLIGRGLTCDPALAGLRDFYVFDLGGGSLECLAFRDRKIAQAVSLPLGCVRLTERCVADTTHPFPGDARLRIADLVRDVLLESPFRFDLPPSAVAVGTGGTITTAREILAARIGRPPAAIDTLITLDQLRELFAYTSRCALADRRRLPGMPFARADVFPTALATVISLADLGGLHAYRHSLYNLRWGLADEALAP